MSCRAPGRTSRVLSNVDRHIPFCTPNTNHVKIKIKPYFAICYQELPTMKLLQFLLVATATLTVGTQAAAAPAMHPADLVSTTRSYTTISSSDPHTPRSLATPTLGQPNCSSESGVKVNAQPGSAILVEVASVVILAPRTQPAVLDRSSHSVVLTVRWCVGGYNV